MVWTNVIDGDGALGVSEMCDLEALGCAVAFWDSPVIRPLSDDDWGWLSTMQVKSCIQVDVTMKPNCHSYTIIKSTMV